MSDQPVIQLNLTPAMRQRATTIMKFVFGILALGFLLLIILSTGLFEHPATKVVKNYYEALEKRSQEAALEYTNPAARDMVKRALVSDLGLNTWDTKLLKFELVSTADKQATVKVSGERGTVVGRRDIIDIVTLSKIENNWVITCKTFYRDWFGWRC